MKDKALRKPCIAPSLEGIPGLKWTRGDEDDDIDDTEEETRASFDSNGSSDNPQIGE